MNRRHPQCVSKQAWSFTCVIVEAISTPAILDLHSPTNMSLPCGFVDLSVVFILALHQGVEGGG